MKYFVLISDSIILPKPEEVTETPEETLSEQNTEQNEALQTVDDIAEPQDIEILPDDDGLYPDENEEIYEEESAEAEETPDQSLAFLYTNSTSGNVILHDTAETDFLLMGYNPAVLAMTELDKTESDTAAEESAYAEESELQEEAEADEGAKDETDEEPTQNTTVEPEVDEDPFLFSEKYNLKACYLSDLKSLADNARHLGIDAVVLDKIDANDTDRKKNLSIVSQAIFGAGYELVYFHLTKSKQLSCHFLIRFLLQSLHIHSTH